MAHYNSFVRIPALILRQAIRPLPTLDPLSADQISLRVWPNDIDFNLHLNNARYLNVMDYGRVRLLARTGLLIPLIRRRYTPVVGSAWMTYRRSLPLWARYTLATRLDSWDDRWFYFEQTFTSREGLIAIGWVKGALLDRGSILAPQQIMDIIHPGLASPPLRESMAILNELTRNKLQNAT